MNQNFTKRWMRSILKEGQEIELGQSIYKVKAILNSRCICSYGGGWTEYQYLFEYVETIIERLQKEVKDLKEIIFKELDDNGKQIHHYVNVTKHTENGKTIYWANCPICGALLYTAEDPITFGHVFPVERPYCQHCGTKVESAWNVGLPTK